jgi:hypothetical protein
MDEETKASRSFIDLVSAYLEPRPARPPRRAGNVSQVELLGRDVWSQLNHYLLLITIHITDGGIGADLAAMLPPGAQVPVAGVVDSLQQWPAQAG